MTASTPGPAGQAVLDQQAARTVDDLARGDGDRCPRAPVEAGHRDSHATLVRTARGTTSCRRSRACERLRAPRRPGAGRGQARPPGARGAVRLRARRRQRPGGGSS